MRLSYRRRHSIWYRQKSRRDMVMVGNTVGLAFSHQGLNAVSAEVGTVQRYGIPRISTEGSSIVAITNSMEIRNAAHRTLWRMK